MINTVNTYDKERMVCGSQNSVLSEGVCNLIFLNNDLFLENLDGIQVACCFLTTQNYLTKSALS